MDGIGNNATSMGDWMPPSPSHRNFFSKLMDQEFEPKSFSNGNEGPFLKSNEQENVVNHNKEEGDAGLQFSTDISSKPNSVNAHKPSLTERRAARAGFSAPTINTDQIRAANFSSSSSEIRSPYLTIPPGLSPTTLLDSPVFLSNSLAQPSPTTGTFSFTQSNTNSFSLVPDETKDRPLEGISQSSDVKLPLGSNRFSFSSGGNQPASTNHPHQSLHFIGTSLQSERELSTDDVNLNQRLSNPTTGNECSPPLDNSQEEEKGESALALGAPAEDGYNWRKYGQKHVKGSEYPRSYYKCTHASCPVKKKVERNHEGQVTEIIYKGAHNHPKPAPNRRSGVPSSHPFNDYQSDGHDWRNDSGLEVTAPASGATEFGETQEAGEVSSTLSNEDEEDLANHGSVSVGCDGEGEETESKRRKVDACQVEMSAGSRAVREPRVVVQTTSEVDILDDGYRWRKYGQKVVKGNPNPRSYYKCTNPGCSVRKHVERASHDLKSVITTYEGKHNHEVPAARGGSGSTSSTPPTSSAPSVPPPAQPQESFVARYDGPAPLAAFNLPGRDRIVPGTTNFSFGVGPPGFSAANLAMSRFGPVALPYMGNFHEAEAGFVVPKRELKEEPESDPSMNMSNGALAYYHQLMSRMPLGPQI